MRHWLLLLLLVACSKPPEPPRPVAKPEPVLPDPEPDPLPLAVTPTVAEPVDLALPATEFMDFADGRVHPGEYLVWRRDDDFAPDVTYWLAVQATSTELLGQYDGLLVASREAVWQWQPAHADLAVCGPLACEEDVPRCKPIRKTGQGMVDGAHWRELGGTRDVPVGPKLPDMAATGLGATVFHESWLPLTVVGGVLVVRVETFWRLCEGGGGGHVIVKSIVPPLPALQPVLASPASVPVDLRALTPGQETRWGGIHQALDREGRWHVDDEWLVPLPAELSATAVESLHTPTRAPAEHLPPALRLVAHDAPRVGTCPLTEDADAANAPRWGWSRLHVTGTHRDHLLHLFQPPP